MNPPIKSVPIVLLGFALVIAGCSQFFSVPAITTPTGTATPYYPPTPLSSEMQALGKFSIEFYRDGKTYEVVTGYDVGEIMSNVTPQPVLPEKYKELGAGFPSIIGYGDFDRDREIEFYATVTHCGASCVQELRLYKYDPAQDQFIVADQVGSDDFRIDRYADLDQDGNPELIVKGIGYRLYGTAGVPLFSAVTVLRYEKGKITDVTQGFPDIIAKDAEDRLSFSRSDGDHQGVAELLLATYLYDMHRLGKLAEARLNFDQVCKDVIIPRIREVHGKSFDCPAFRAEVEAEIQKYEQSKQ